MNSTRTAENFIRTYVDPDAVLSDDVVSAVVAYLAAEDLVADEVSEDEWGYIIDRATGEYRKA